MAKEAISATLEVETVEAVKKIAEEERRSFSQMVDILLELAIPVFNENKKK